MKPATLFVTGNGKNSAGVTLIELLVVFWLIGIVCAAAAVSFDISGWLAHYRLKGTARALFINLQKARMNAVKEMRDWAVKFDAENAAYCFQYKNDAGQWVQYGNSIELGKNVVYGHGRANHTVPGEEFKSDVTFTGQRATFNELGLPTKSGYCYLTNDRGDAYAVGTNNVGTIKMLKWNGNDWE